MKKKKNIKGIFSMLLITILSLAIIIVCVFFAAYGLSVRLQDEPFQIGGVSIYPNLDEKGSPLSYSAVVYDARHTISQGNAVAYLEPQSKASCKLTTAYFYGLDDSECVLYDNVSSQFYNIARENLRGRALFYIPYLGVLLSLSSSVAGLILFVVLGAAVFLLLFIYLITFVKGRNEIAALAEENFAEPIADDAPAADLPQEQPLAEDKPEEEEQAEDADEEPAQDEEPITPQPESDDLILKVKSKGEKYYASIVGPIDKVTRLERAVNNLLEKKDIEMSVEPIEGEPAGTGIECDKDGLAIVIALVKKLNE